MFNNLKFYLPLSQLVHTFKLNFSNSKQFWPNFVMIIRMNKMGTLGELTVMVCCSHLNLSDEQCSLIGDHELQWSGSAEQSTSYQELPVFNIFSLGLPVV